MDYTIAGVEGGVCAPRGFRAAGVDAGLSPADARPEAGRGAAGDLAPPGRPVQPTGADTAAGTGLDAAIRPPGGRAGGGQRPPDGDQEPEPVVTAGQPDLALIVSQHTATVAGRLTTHRFASAPVRRARERLSAGTGRAVVIHAGVANAATGAAGLEDAEAVADATGRALGCPAGEVVVLGTGRVGPRLDLAAAAEGVSKAAASLSRRGSTDAALAITAGGGVRCERAAAVAWTEGELRIGGIAKASPPFAPAFATTLAVLTTDARADAALLGEILSRAVRRSFERVLVDQGPGMGDAVILLANGTAAAPALLAGSEGAAAFEAALSQLCEALAEGLALRTPGSRKLLAVTVHGAATHADALTAARAVAGSVALRVELANGFAAWPAVLDALGGCDAPFHPDRVSVRFGPVTVVTLGRLTPHDEVAAAAVAAKAQVDLAVDLGAGNAAATVTTTDLPWLARPSRPSL